ncbi:MAG: hypothetical protein ACRD4D_09795 [Candidatus Acidiferrales bacterium]
MNSWNGANRGLLFALLLALAGATLLVAQERGRPGPPPKEEKKEGKEEKKASSRRLFGEGKINMRSSRQEEDTLGAGFKGVDKDGKVKKDALAARPGATEFAQVAAMKQYEIPAEEFAAFLAQAGLKKKESAPPAGGD